MAKRVTVRVYGHKVRVRPKVAKQIRARKQSFKQPLLQPMQQLSGQALQKAAHQLTNLQIKPQLSAIDRASSTAAAQGAAQSDRLGGYYRQLAQEAQQGIARTAAIGQRTVAGIGTTGREEQQQLNSADQMVSGQEQTDQAVRGTGLQFGDRAREELAAAKAAAAQRTGTDETVSTNYSQNFQDIQNAMAGATSMRGGEAQTQLANMLANQQAQYRGQRQDIQSQKGNAYTKNLLDLRNTSFENQAVIQGLLGDQAKVAADVQMHNSDNQLKLQLARLSTRNARALANLQGKSAIKLATIKARLDAGQKLSPQQQYELGLLTHGLDPKTLQPIPGFKGSSGGDGNKPTAGEIASAGKAYDTIGSVISAHANHPPGLQGRIKLADQLKAGRPAVKDPKTGHVIVEATPPMPPEVVRAAMDILYDKHLSKGTRAALRARYPGLYRKLIKAGYKGPTGRPRTPTTPFDRPGATGH